MIAFIIIFFLAFLAVATAIYIIAGKNLKNANRETEMMYGGKIEGMILRKGTGRPVEGVDVLLGELTVKNGVHKFLREKEIKAISDKNGKYKFYGLEVKGYWVYVEAEGKKIVRMVKLTEEKPEEDGVLITL
jgi:hypothetical protein